MDTKAISTWYRWHRSVPFRSVCNRYSQSHAYTFPWRLQQATDASYYVYSLSRFSLFSCPVALEHGCKKLPTSLSFSQCPSTSECCQIGYSISNKMFDQTAFKREWPHEAALISAGESRLKEVDFLLPSDKFTRLKNIYSLYAGDATRCAKVALLISASCYSRAFVLVWYYGV